MESEDKQEACFLDMPNGLSREVAYSQKFVRAPKSSYPMKAQGKGKPPKDIMGVVLCR